MSAVGRPSVLVVCAASIGHELTDAGIRSYELARALRPHAEVTLAAVASADSSPGVVPYDLNEPQALRPLIAAAGAVVCQPGSPQVTAWLCDSAARVVYDLHDPEPLELLEVRRRRRPRLRRFVGRPMLDRYLGALRDGNRFVCASERQRDLWLGAMLGVGRLGIAAYDRDPSGRGLIDVVPFGIPAEPPTPSAGGAHARFPALGPEAEIVLWNDAISSRLDAPTAVRAMAELQERRPQARLVFMGAGTDAAARTATERARSLAAQLGLLDRSVFVNDRSPPYDERAAWLLEAACAISTHVERLDTRFAFRARLLDCFWAGLPVVCTHGDDLAALIGREQLGAVVPEGDTAAVATALDTVLQRGRSAYREDLARAAETYRWDRVVKPLVRYVT